MRSGSRRVPVTHRGAMSTEPVTVQLATVLARRRRARVLFGALGVALAALAVVSLGWGQVEIAPGQSLAILADELLGIELPWSYDRTQAAVLTLIRLPRVVLAALVGAALAISGAALQGLFRNPLADPTLIGVSSGAALTVALALVFGGVWIGTLGVTGSILALPVAALVGGLAAAALVWRISTRHGRTSVVTMLLAGIAINALCGAGIGLCVYAANDAQLRDITFWMLGSVSGATWPLVSAVLPFFAFTLLVLPRLSRSLNAMLLGEAEASHLGVRVDRVKRWIIGVTALAVGAAVSMSGIIGFVGLVVPHIVRLTAGPDHRVLIPASAMLGALVLMASDLAARTVVAPADLPIGIVTALIGSPVFLWLLVVRHSARGEVA